MINKAIFEKTFKDFFRLKTILVYSVFLAVPLVIFSQIALEANFFNVTSLDLMVEYLFGFFSVLSYVWVSGVAISLLSAYFCSSMIAEEVSDRTILLLVTKPVSRASIFMSKFLAFLVSILIYSALSLFLSVYIWASVFELDLASLMVFVSKIPYFFIYSVFVALFFGSISAAISALSSSKLKSIIPSVLLVIVAFFVFIQIRDVSRDMGAYEGVLSFTDVGYDFGNLYISILEAGGVRFIPLMQGVLGTFTGVYDVPDEFVDVDYDHGIIKPSLERLKYRSPVVSLIKLIVLPGILTLLGLLVFVKRDIS
ncbi:MAG: ABC transporter permease [Candidatus Altiarchaeota archaeon]|nr:ABC transporter permease [Candidatus Altiarchaeota archaeon]